MKKIIILFALSTTLGINLSFAGGVPASNSDTSTNTSLTHTVDLNNPERINEGKEIFHSTCADYCHGHEPALFIGRGDGLEPDSIYKTIFDGGQGATPMPPWGEVFDEEEIWSLVAYIKYLGSTE